MQPVREILFFLFMAALFLFMPQRLIRAIILGALLYRLLALMLYVLIPRILEVELSETAHYATLHDPFQLEIRIRNRSPLPLPHFQLEARAQGLEFLGTSVRVQPLNGYGGCTLSLRLVGDHRGIHLFGPFVLQGSDPLRLFRWTKYTGKVRNVVIYPSIFSLSHKITRGLIGGNLNVQNPIYEDVTSFMALRKYQSGDELKRINWKASARMGELYSNLYESSLYFPVLILLNLSEREYPLNQRQDLVEKAIATAGSLALHFQQLNQSVGLFHTGLPRGPAGQPRGKSKNPSIVLPGLGHGQSARILEELAGAETHPEGLGVKELLRHPLLRINRGTKYLLITPPPLSEDLLFIREQRRLGMDLELYLVSGLHSHQRGLTPPGIPCTTVHPGGGAFF